MEASYLDPRVRATWQIPRFVISFWRGRTQRWCVVIPVINEGRRIRHLLARMAALDISSAADIVLVDGGSTDGSLEQTMLLEYGVRGLLVKTGPGKLSAQLRCAYAFAVDHGYEGIVTIDGNNKDDPEGVHRFIAAIQEGYDMVQASRYIPGGVAENTPLIRNLAIRWIHAPMLSLFSGFRWTDTTQGFRAYSRRMFLDPQLAPLRDVFMEYELLAYMSYRAPRLGYRCIELPTTRRYPPGEVPTKIGGIKGNVSLLLVLLRTCFGGYDPKKSGKSSHGPVLQKR